MSEFDVQDENQSSVEFDVHAESAARQRPGMKTAVAVPDGGKTFDYNRAVINQLWPTLNLSGEERKLWRDDLSGLDQDVLCDAIRNVKRTHDAPWPQLKWVLDEYRELHAARRRLVTPAKPQEPRPKLDVSDEEDSRTTKELRDYIDGCVPADFPQVKELVLDKVYNPATRKTTIYGSSGFRLLNYAKMRFFPDAVGLSRVTSSGDLVPIRFGGDIT